MYLRILLALVLLSLTAARLSAQYDQDTFYYRGRQAISEGRYADAISNFNILARLDTANHLTYFFRGIAKYNLGDIRGAQEDFDHSVRINPVFTSGYHYRAITESRSGNYDKSIEDIEHAISLRPGYEGLYFTRGVIYFLSQQFDKALKDFDWYIRRVPDDPSAYLNRGATNLFLKDTTAAFADYDKAISLDPFEPDGYMRRGRLEAARGEYDKGLADMDKAISLDTTSTLAYFNRALMYYETKDYNSAMADLNRVLRDDPGNALTLYNRSLISAQVGNYEDALSDMDRVININPRNVLAYYNRASFFVQMERWQDALEDYDKAIELYPDFAKAYMNRSYVENMLGHNKASKQDYETARKKVAEYRAANDKAAGSFADTTRKYSSLLALDADFAKKDFDDELLQHRDVDIRLRPLYRFVLTKERAIAYALRNRYEDRLVDKFIADSPVPIVVTNSDTLYSSIDSKTLSVLYDEAPPKGVSAATMDFLRGLDEVGQKQFNSALNYYDDATSALQDNVYEQMYQGFYLMNRAVLRADMIEFISNIESNVQTLSMDDTKTARARVKDEVTRTYDYSEAVADLQAALEAAPDVAYIHFDLANLYVLSSKLVEAIGSYTKALELWPAMGDAYYNRGLVQIYLKDKEKGCIDLSRAGELGVAESYRVISKYCEEEQQ